MMYLRLVLIQRRKRPNMTEKLLNGAVKHQLKQTNEPNPLIHGNAFLTTLKYYDFEIL